MNFHGEAHGIVVMVSPASCSIASEVMDVNSEVR